MRKVYVVATNEGFMPSDILTAEHRCKKALSLCKRGWPEKQWRAFEFEQEGKSIFIPTDTSDMLIENIKKRKRDILFITQQKLTYKF